MTQLNNALEVTSSKNKHNVLYLFQYKGVLCLVRSLTNSLLKTANFTCLKVQSALQLLMTIPALIQLIRTRQNLFLIPLSFTFKHKKHRQKGNTVLETNVETDK